MTSLLLLLLLCWRWTLLTRQDPWEFTIWRKIEIGHVRSDVEQERGGNSPPPLKAVESLAHMYQLSTFVRPVHLADPAEAQVEAEMVAIYHEIMPWFEYIKAYAETHKDYSVHDAINVLARVRGEDKLVAFLFRVRKFDHLKRLADRLQSALAEKKPDNVRLIMDMCLRAEVDPEQVFFMMPIAEEIRTRGVNDRERWPEMHRKFEQWMVYTWEFRSHVRAGQRQRRWDREMVDDSVLQNLAHAVLEPLVKHSEPEYLVEFLEYLRVEKGMHIFGSKMQQLLLAKHPATIETLMFDVWANSGMSPQDVYQSLPIASLSVVMIDDTTVKLAPVNMHAASEGHNFFATMMDKIPLVDIIKKLNQLFKFVDVYRVHHSFDDEKVVGLLLHSKPAPEAHAYLLFLEEQPGRKEQAAQLLGILRGLYSPLQYEEMNILAWKIRWVLLEDSIADKYHGL
uniref:RxLR effector candidate protein n=1 Tax=Peronospora matthiolae TaxID=2874970 RepID=A0AAV1VF13_9STRA